MSEPLEILYEDERIVAVNKPSGLLVHRSWIDREATAFALQTVRDMTGRYVHPVHRLDKPTSGVLVFAFDKEAARRMGELFAEGSVHKRYLAVVRGYTDEAGVIDYPLREILDKMTDAKARDDKEAQEAVTNYRRLATVELPIPVSRYPVARYSLVELSPETGRKHQLRRHMKHIFHPIVGDTKYGRTEHNRLFRKHFDSHRLLLHAASIEFPHPIDGETVEIGAPMPEDFMKIARLFGKIPEKMQTGLSGE
ncbi:tRNA pseudouridine(65) synthase TruC [Hydrogenimonas sp.]|uniref:tRNA pseudouridine(65) synthase TruC n=1 Tax=Hydrogenimonas sp. TaxID=2231112 RepID=UPI00260B89E1|nr:tRNA pseudouridine(65) synthase TruC [Hydrogenimonas sp.]